MPETTLERRQAKPLPAIGEVEGWRVYIYLERAHAMPHIHVRKGGMSAAFSLEGELLAGTVQLNEQRTIEQWLLARQSTILAAIQDLKEGRSPQWIP